MTIHVMFVLEAGIVITAILQYLLTKILAKFVKAPVFVLIATEREGFLCIMIIEIIFLNS